MIIQGTPFASLLSMARTSESLLTGNVHPVLVLVSEIPAEASSGFAPHQATELDSLAFHQTEALRRIPTHGLVYVVRKRGSGLVRDRIGIGRDHNADIYVASPRMSRYHAFFSMTPGNDWMMTDANSKNGSRVAGVRVATGVSYMLPETASISLGGIEFTFYMPEQFVTLCRGFLSTESAAALTVAG